MKWRSVTTGEDTYYINETTGETSWQIPTAHGHDIRDEKRTKSGGVKSAKALHLQTQKTAGGQGGTKAKRNWRKAGLKVKAALALRKVGSGKKGHEKA